MSNFMGAALYTKEEVGKALNNRQILNSKYSKIQNEAVQKTKTVDTSYRRLGFLWKIERSAYDDLVEECSFMFGSYIWRFQWLLANNYITEMQEEGIKLHLHWYEKQVKDITNLYNGGKDLYLNPEQAEFVNLYKNRVIEEEKL